MTVAEMSVGVTSIDILNFAIDCKEKLPLVKLSMPEYMPIYEALLESVKYLMMINSMEKRHSVYRIKRIDPMRFVPFLNHVSNVIDRGAVVKVQSLKKCACHIFEWVVCNILNKKSVWLERIRWHCPSMPVLELQESCEDITSCKTFAGVLELVHRVVSSSGCSTFLKVEDRLIVAKGKVSSFIKRLEI